MAGVAALREGRGGVDGVPPAAQHVRRVQELRVGHRLRQEGGRGGENAAARRAVPTSTLRPQQEGAVTCIPASVEPAGFSRPQRRNAACKAKTLRWLGAPLLLFRQIHQNTV